MPNPSSSQVVTPFPQRGIQCLKLRRIDRGALIGFCDLEVLGWNLMLHDCKWFAKDGREWIGLPSSSYINREGKTVYKDLVEFTDKQAKQRFDTAAVAAIKAFEQ